MATSPAPQKARPGHKRLPIGGVSPVPRKGAIRDVETVVAPSGPRPASAAFPGFSYHGGPVVRFPQVYATYWGDLWLSDAAHLERAARLSQFLTDMLGSTYMNILSQYGATSGAGTACFMRASFVSGIANSISDVDIHNTIQNCINASVLPEPNPNTCLVIYLADGIGVDDTTDDIVMCEASSDNAFGYHSFFTTAAGNPFYYAVIPGLTDACLRESCPNDATCSLHLAETQEQRQTQVTSHEFCEMATDPQLNAWYDSAAGEIGDVCNGETATLTAGANTWNVQREYSKTDDINSNGATFCVASEPNPLPKLSPGPASSVSQVARIQQLQAITKFLPLPPIHFDSAKKKTRVDEKELQAFATKIFHPFHHSDLIAGVPEFLRQFADALERNKK